MCRSCEVPGKAAVRIPLERPARKSLSRFRGIFLRPRARWVHRETQLLRKGAHPLIEGHNREQIVKVGPEVHRRGRMNGVERMRSSIESSTSLKVIECMNVNNSPIRPSAHGSSGGSLCARAALLIPITHSAFRRLDESRSEDSSHSRVTLRSTPCCSKPESMTLESK
jgi:hypothetical protein